MERITPDSTLRCRSSPSARLPKSPTFTPSLRDVDRLVQAQKLSQDEGINLSGITRILELQEETRQLRRQIKRMRAENDGSVFAAGRDGDIVEMQRSNSARRWRRDIHATVRELPSGASGYDPNARTDSKSVILWGYR